MSSQISAEEYYRRHATPQEYERRRRLGQFGNTEQREERSNDPGAPGVGYSQSEIDEIIAEQGNNLANAGRTKGDRLVKRVRIGAAPGGADLTRYSKGVGRGDFERMESEQGIEDLVRQQKIAEALASADPGSPFAAVAQEFTQGKVISEALGRPVSESIASRASDYVRALGITPEQAVQLAEAQAIAGPRATTRRMKGLIGQELVDAIGSSGELTPDPAARALIAAARDGVIVDEVPVEGQARALSPYLEAAERFALESGAPMRQLDEKETRQAALVDGRGRKTRSGRRNAFNKEPGQEAPDPYLVPALLAKAVDETKYGRQPRTYWEDKRAHVDPRMVQMALLNPAAPLDPSLGYLRKAARDKVQTGNYEATGNVPSPEMLANELYGLSPAEDIATEYESVPMTLGQATRDITYRNRTPLVDIPDSEIAEMADGSLVHTRSGQKVFPYEQTQPGIATYRVGTPFEYKKEALAEFGNLIEAVTGQRLVVNEKVMDSDMWRLQRAALGRAVSDDMRAVKGAKTWGEIERGGIEDERFRTVPIEGSNPTYDLIKALKEGSRIRGEEVERPVVVREGAEVDFYRELLGGQMNELRAAVSAKMAASQQGSSVPQSAVVNTAEVSQLNAPAPQGGSGWRRFMKP